MKIELTLGEVVAMLILTAILSAVYMFTGWGVEPFATLGAVAFGWIGRKFIIQWLK